MTCSGPDEEEVEEEEKVMEGHASTWHVPQSEGVTGLKRLIRGCKAGPGPEPQEHRASFNYSRQKTPRHR